MDKELKQAMERVQELHEKLGVKQKGDKKYTQVVHRVQALREVYGTEISIQTEIMSIDKERVVVKAIVLIGGNIIGSGHAEEWRSEGYINKTSALENCETSAIGRALASIGLGGGEYASVEEINIAKNKAGHEPQKTNGMQEAQEDALKEWPAKFGDYKDFYTRSLNALNNSIDIPALEKSWKFVDGWRTTMKANNIITKEQATELLEKYQQCKDDLERAQ